MYSLSGIHMEGLCANHEQQVTGLHNLAQCITQLQTG